MGRAAIVCRLTYVVSHPIQYQAPLLRRIAAEPDIRLRVLFERVDPDNTYFDTGFGRQVSWDVPLTDGYEFAVLGSVDVGREIAATDALWVHGWQTSTIRDILARAHAQGCRTLMRGENCDLAMPDGAAPRRWLKRLHIRRIFANCDAFLAIGSLNRAYYVERGIEGARIFDMPYAVDNDSFFARADEARAGHAAMRARHGINPNAQVILFAGKLMARKRADLLIEAMHRLKSSVPAHLLIVGDGEDRARLEANAPDAAFAGFVNQSELPAYYGLADVFVLPSEMEPWGLAVNEAMASGTAVVVSDQVGCAPDLVSDDVGRVFPAGDPDALAKALAETLADAEPMGDRARARIAAWDFETDVRGLRRALQSLEVL